MRRLLKVELRKMRRLHPVFIAVCLGGLIAVLSSATLFTSSFQSSIGDPGFAAWPRLLLSYVVVAAMSSPIMVAILASRQTDIENTGSGWLLAASTGYGPDKLCWAKLIIVGALIIITTWMQTVFIVTAGIISGIQSPLNIGMWFGYTTLLSLVNLAFCGFHIWLSAAIDNQVANIGVGIIGGFAAVFCLLISPTIARLIPWGYYALITPVTAGEHGPVLVEFPYVWIVGFLLLAGILFYVLTERLNRVER